MDDDWNQYPDGLYINIVFPEEIKFKNPPFVTTYLTCKSHCWSTEGVTSIYFLTNKGFRVYIQQDGITVAKAHDLEWKLNFKA